MFKEILAVYLFILFCIVCYLLLLSYFLLMFGLVMCMTSCAFCVY